MSTPSPPEPVTDPWWDALAVRSSEDAEYRVASRWIACTVGVRVDRAEVHAELGHGRMSWSRGAGPFDDSWDLALSGPAGAWAGFVAPTPPPGHQDVLAMAATIDGFEILGDRLVLFQHLRAIQRWARLFREVGR